MTVPPPKALDGIKVVDLTRILAGPWATQLLGDYGADIIKVERPGVGDDTRKWGPPFVERADGSGQDAAYFYAANRNKKFITVDFTKPTGADIIRKLVADADVFVENFKTGGLAKYGLDYDSLKKLNPKLVYCSITGFGQTGPLAKKAGYDFMMQAMSGFMAITGQPDGVAGAEPMRAGVAIVDLFTGMYAANGTLAALFHAKATGEGQYIDIALYDTALAVLANQAANYLATGDSPGRIGNTHPNIVPYQVFPTKDGHIVLAVGNDDQYRDLCEVASAPGLSTVVDYATNENRVRNRTALVEALSPIMRGKTTQNWLDALENAGVPCGPIQSVGDALDHAQAKARQVVDTGNGPVPLVRNPVNMSVTPAAINTPPGATSQDTTEVLRAAGFSDADIAHFRQNGTI